MRTLYRIWADNGECAELIVDRSLKGTPLPFPVDYRSPIKRTGKTRSEAADTLLYNRRLGRRIDIQRGV